MIEPRVPLMMVRDRGCTDSVSHFRHQVARLRPKPAAEAYLRLKTLPGEQAQVDWAHFGTVPIGRAQGRLLAFVMVRSWSRQLFLSPTRRSEAASAATGTPNQTTAPDSALRSGHRR